MSFDVYYKLLIYMIVLFSTFVFNSSLLPANLFTCLPLIGHLVESFIWRMVLYQTKCTHELYITFQRFTVNI